MRPEMEKPDGALVSATDPVEGQPLPVGTAENGPDARKAKSAAVSPPLADIAARINEAHDRASASARSTIVAAMEAGRLLIQAKAEVVHGGWLSWLKANTSVSERTAQYYMKLADDPSKSAIIADLTLVGALKLLAPPKTDPKRQTAHNRSAASPKSAKVEVLPPEPKLPGSSPNLLLDGVLVDRIRGDIEVAERRGIDITNLVLEPPTLDPQTSVPPLRMPADSEPEISHRPPAVTDGINTINDTEYADTADDTDELDVRYGPLTGREWIAFSERVEMHDQQRDPHDHKPGEPQYCPEFLRLVEFFQLPFARWRDRIIAGNAMEPCLPREDDTDHAGGIE
jgi:hypothetical protein